MTSRTVRDMMPKPASPYDSSSDDLFLVHYSRSSAFATCFSRSQIRGCFPLILWDSELCREQRWWIRSLNVEWHCHRAVMRKCEIKWLLFLFDCSCHTTISLLRLSLLSAQGSRALTVTAWLQSDKTIPLPSRACLPWKLFSPDRLVSFSSHDYAHIIPT